tara:strand:+ start:1043 stop:2317 length:1275 start_codon:yes stop_codon:yes gene_type:complete
MNIIINSSLDYPNTLDFDKDTCGVSFCREIDFKLIEDIDGIIIGLDRDESDIEQITKNIRQQSNFFIPIITLKEGVSLTTAINKLTDSIEKISKWIDRYDVKSLHLTEVEKLVVFMYLNKIEVLIPQLSTADMRYSYPLAEYFFSDLSTAAQQIMGSDFFKFIDFIDQYYTCNKCSSSKIFFSESCPSCKSKNLSFENFLHCFYCGHINFESKFINVEEISCPRCLKILNRVGEDFDRPLESGSCKVCEQRFTEPKLLAKCISCCEEISPDQLSRNYIYKLALKPNAIHKIEKKASESLELSKNTVMNLVDFIPIVNWLIGTMSHNNEMSITLICLKYNNNNFLHLKKLVADVLNDSDLIGNDHVNNLLYLMVLQPDKKHEVFLNHEDYVGYFGPQVSGKKCTVSSESNVSNFYTLLDSMDDIR